MARCSFQELRNVCFADGDSYIEVAFLCNIDANTDQFFDQNDLRTATKKSFAQNGMFLISLQYYRDGRLVKSLNNSIDKYNKVAGNLYERIGGS